MLIHPDPHEVLLVGVGAGLTASRFLMYGIDRLTCVEIEPAVFELLRSHFDATWMADDRVELVFGDGRNHVAHSEDLFDIISIEVGQVFRPGVGAFYTADFYELARARLWPGGLLAQFVSMPSFDVNQFQAGHSKDEAGQPRRPEGGRLAPTGPISR
jgi:spermidine synthase